MKTAILSDIQLVSDFIQRVWNENQLLEMSDYLHDHFVDYSMPFSYLQNRHGLLVYLKEMAARTSHYTEVLEISMVDEFVVCKIRIRIVNLSQNADTNADPEIIEACRLFKMHENLIIAHWEML